MNQKYESNLNRTIFINIFPTCGKRGGEKGKKEFAFEFIIRNYCN